MCSNVDLIFFFNFSMFGVFAAMERLRLDSTENTIFFLCRKIGFHDDKFSLALSLKNSISLSLFVSLSLCRSVSLCLSLSPSVSSSLYCSCAHALSFSFALSLALSLSLSASFRYLPATSGASPDVFVFACVFECVRACCILGGKREEGREGVRERGRREKCSVRITQNLCVFVCIYRERERQRESVHERERARERENKRANEREREREREG